MVSILRLARGVRPPRVGKVEVGPGGTRTSKGGRDFLSLKLDDPSVAAPIYANLVERHGQHERIWSR